MIPTLNVKGIFDLPFGGFWERVKPFAQGGIGLAFVDLTPGPTDTDFALNFGMGANVYLTTNFNLGTSMMFNIIPGGLFGDNFAFTWQVLTAGWHF